MLPEGLTASPTTRLVLSNIVELRVISDIGVPSDMSAEEYLFQKSEDGTFVRKLLGQESMLATAA